MGGAPKQTTTIQDVPAEFKPYFTDLFSAAQRAYSQASRPDYRGPIYPAPTAQTPQQSVSGYPSVGPYYGYGMMPGPSMANNWGMPMLGQGMPPAAMQQGLQFANPAVAAQLGFPTVTGQPAQGQQQGENKPQQQSYSGSAYPGQYLAPTNPLEMEALAGREQVARQLFGLGNPLLQTAQMQAGGAFLNPQTNPYLNTAINYALTPAIQQFIGSTLPAFESQALASGAYKGSSARDMALQGLMGQFGRDILGTAGTIGYGDYAQERQLQQNAGTLLNQAAGLQQLGPDILAQAGYGAREAAQRPLDEMLMQWQAQQTAPYQALMPLASILQGTDIGKLVQTTLPQSSPLSQGIAGALGGAGLGASIANTAGWGSGGTLASTGLGSLAGLLGGLI